MNEEITIFSNDSLVAIAQQAEARIDAVVKIKQLALKVTNNNDWVDQDGKPYLMASGSEKIANLFNISWRIDEPTMEEEADGAITYIYKGYFSLSGRSIEVEGSRSSRDTFFKKYEYENGKRVGEKPLDRRDLKMAAMTNLLGNGITRILGIRNLTYEDLNAFAGINQADVKGVKYRKPEMKKPQAKPGPKKEQPEEKPDNRKISDPQRQRFYAIAKGAGKTDEQIKAYLAIALNIEHAADIPVIMYDELCEWAAKENDQERNAGEDDE